MHEMGIAQEILGIVEREVEARPEARVKAVGVRVGRCSGVDAESLRFCFECLKKDTVVEAAELLIERTPADELEVAQVELEVA